MHSARALSRRLRYRWVLLDLGPQVTGNVVVHYDDTNPADRFPVVSVPAVCACVCVTGGLQLFVGD